MSTGLVGCEGVRGEVIDKRCKRCVEPKLHLWCKRCVEPFDVSDVMSPTKYKPQIAQKITESCYFYLSPPLCHYVSSVVFRNLISKISKVSGVLVTATRWYTKTLNHLIFRQCPKTAMYAGDAYNPSPHVFRAVAIRLTSTPFPFPSQLRRG